MRSFNFQNIAQNQRFVVQKQFENLNQSQI